MAHAADPSGDAERGAVLAGLGGCASCHTTEDGAPFAGGYVLDTRWGRFVGTNLTPDPTHGIGAWDFDDFRRAMRKGRSPRGRPYYPAFPYAAFTDITDGDLADLWAYLRTVEPVAQDNPDHALNGLNDWRFLLRFWKISEFRPGPYAAPRDADAELARGEYLGTAVGHCGECHTPRGPLGGPKKRLTHAGTDEPPEPAPNISPAHSGIGAWSTTELVSFLEDGMTPEGDVTGGEMRRLVKHGTALLSEADRRALAVWVLSLDPVETRGGDRPADIGDDDDEYHREPDEF